MLNTIIYIYSARTETCKIINFQILVKKLINIGFFSIRSSFGFPHGKSWKVFKCLSNWKQCSNFETILSSFKKIQRALSVQIFSEFGNKNHHRQLDRQNLGGENLFHSSRKELIVKNLPAIENGIHLKLKI